MLVLKCLEMSSLGQLKMILPDRAYAFFSHTHKAQKENMPLLDKILEERVSLFDYELIVGDDGKRLLAFGKFAGRAGLIDFLHGLGQRYLSLGYSTPFLSLGQSHMYPSLAAAKAAVIAVGEEIATFGLPSGISPIVFIFTGDGNVSQGAQEIFKLLPHTFVEAEKLPEISAVDYYAHPEHYNPVFHERIAPYASVIVNCMYWERRFPRLLSIDHLKQLMKNGCPLVGISDITCDVGGSIEFVDKSTSIERPFFRYNPSTNSYHDDMEALDVIEKAGGSFHLVRCDVGQSIDDMSYSELEVGADDADNLDRIIDTLTSLAKDHDGDPNARKETEISLEIGKVNGCRTDDTMDKGGPKVLILGAGRVCRPAAEFLASSPNTFACGANDNNACQVHVIVASLYQKDSEETVDGIKNATATQLDVTDTERLSDLVSQVEVVVSLLPASCHASIARLKKHMVTASYVDESMSKLSQAAECAGVTILCEMGLDPGIDHMMAMKMIDEAHARQGKIKAFTSFCGGLPSPAAANNPLAYKFSWSPAGAIRAGKNPAVFKFLGEIIHVDGNTLFDSAKRLRLPELPAFALEHLPNRNSLIYGELYGISKEASTVYRATLRYEGFCEIMAILSKIGWFDAVDHPLLQGNNHPTYRSFLHELLNFNNISTTATNDEASGGHDDDLISRLLILGHCKEKEIAIKTVKTIKFLGLNEETRIPKDCSSAFDVICQRMEQKMAYEDNEQDMVLLHHEIEVEYADGRPKEKHQATLLEFGKVEDGRSTTAMALTVGIPAAIGAQLLLQNKVQRKGVIRPLEPEVYIPALEILESSGIKLMERVQT
ncbi:hypothetical protein PR202_ga02981 [Eleusine coracana subsp. coracana]|uniref:Alanine dehydrogenase/pyridine nucleotide transhydrogenase NAD(H)-binding domain-containing protein n=1 Tax=Eleusine coracana subsp. coracana TaxID=191504 RepID=A0AAV5BN91_ELECO|nr:hypothetical protein PR202_ga02981 [Eleusine coracana subsp. coracana]